MLQIECPGCSSVFRVPEQHAGKRARCPKCRTELVVPSPDDGLEEAGVEEVEEVGEQGREPAPAASAPAAGNPLVPVGAALGAALLGALVWTLITGSTGYEIGFVAWGIGAAVGAAAWKTGGRGAGVALACAVLALASIAGGKLGTAWLARKEVIDGLGERFPRELYEEVLRDADDWSQLPADPDRTLVTSFMVEHGYTESSEPSRVEDDEFFAFCDEAIPMLEALHSQPPGYEAWAEEGVASSRRMLAQGVPLTGIVRENLSGFDLLWVFLGVSTAFTLVLRNTRAEQEARRASARARRRSR